MKSRFQISPAIAWQSYDCIDLLIVLNRENGEFYFFQDTGRFILDNLLQGLELDQICERGIQKYDITYPVLLRNIEEFVLLLKQEKIIYEFSEF